MWAVPLSTTSETSPRTPALRWPGHSSVWASGILLGFVLAMLMDRFEEPIQSCVFPLLVISQTIPTVAIAPLLVLWMGYGIAPKVTLIILVCFFPIAVGLLDGFRASDPDAVNLMRAMGASKGQIFRHISSLPLCRAFFPVSKIAVSYAIVGAVISEWLGGNEGLGVYMIRVKKSYSYDKMFAVILVIIIISLALISSCWLEHLVAKIRFLAANHVHAQTFITAQQFK